MALFLRSDLSQVEDRLVKVLSHDPELVELARRKPWEFDVHTFNAALLFEIEEKDVTKRERQAGKRIVHASNYDAGPQRVSDALLDEGFIVPVEECAARQEIYHRRFPGVRGGYQLRTRMLVIRERQLVASDGFRICFPYERLDGATFRRAYAWRPQREAALILNQGGLIPSHTFIREHNLRSRLAFQVHDECVIIAADVREAWDLARLLRDGLEAEREYEGEKLSVPAEFMLESRYHGRPGEVIEWKRFPEQFEFEAAWTKLASTPCAS